MSNLSTQQEEDYLQKSNDMSVTMRPSSVDASSSSSNKYPFWFGGSASAMATLLTHPLDLGQTLHSLSVISLTYFQ